MSYRARGFSCSRRRFVVGAGVAAWALVGPRRVQARQAATPAAGAWTFVDDAGVTISRPRRPERVVAYLPLAAAFHDFGLPTIAYYGDPLAPDGTRQTIAGDLDLDAVEAVGEEYGHIDMERLVALQPDLIVNDMWADPPDVWGLDAGAIDLLNRIAPVANILFIDRPITETIGRVEALAAALGADLTAPDVVASKAAFDDAVAAMRSAIAEKPGLTAAFVSGLPEESFWVGNPRTMADLRFYADLGLDIVQPETTDGFFEELSWEQAGKYPADLLLIDDRQWSATGEELVAQVPTFAALPAAKAGAFAPWPTEYVPSYAGMTPVLEALTAAIRAADPGIV